MLEENENEGYDDEEPEYGGEKEGDESIDADLARKEALRSEREMSCNKTKMLNI